MNDQKLKILWVSDIHFFKEYKKLKNDIKFQYYISDFIAKSNLTHTSESPIDYILFSGDLAQQGTKKDYDALWTMLIQPLFDKFLSQRNIPKPKFITIPGNHDVNWSNSDFVEEFIKNIVPGVDESQRRSNYLSNEREKFTKLFSDYSDFINGIAKRSNGKYSDFIFEDNGRNKIKSKEYSKDALFGYVIDHDKNLIFIMLNSAWFSLGDNFNNLFAKYLKKINKHSISLQKIKGILETKDSLIEYSSQITGLSFFEYESLMNVIKLYNDYFVVTTMHHPLNWLEWQEQYSYKDSPNANSAKLKEILKRSDIFLTGHEHVPQGVELEKIHNETIHFRGGCFLFERQKQDELKLQNSWFSILDINIDIGSLNQTRLFYDIPNSSWIINNEVNGSYKLPKKNYKYEIDNGRVRVLFDLINSLSEKNILNYLNQRGLQIKDVQEINSKISSLRLFDVQVKKRIELRYKSELIILALNDTFYESVNTDSFFKMFNEIMASNEYKFDKVAFVVLDLFVNKKSLEIYQTNWHYEGGRYTLLHGICKNADSIFDSFRSYFFGQFELNLSDTESVKLFEKYYNLKFINIIIPFWKFRKYFA